MFSSNCVFDLLTQSTQFDFTVRCFVLSVFPQRSVFLTYKVANFTIDPGRGVGVLYSFYWNKIGHDRQKIVFPLHPAIIREVMFIGGRC
jgi:hypothetical protein